MTKYADMAKEAKEKKTGRSLTPEYVKFEKKGQSIIGLFISKSAIQSSTGDGSYNQYLMETDEGNVKFHLGSAADAEVGEVFKPGVVYSIEFQGQEDIGGGRKVNKFDIMELGPVGQ
jgi:hypothetical protein